MAALCSLRIVCAARAPKVAAVAEDKAAPVLKSGQKYKNLGSAVDAGLIQGCAPFDKGLDMFGFFSNVDHAEAQRIADSEITHGRVAMLAALGFVVGEQVEGSSFLFDSEITGPAIRHFEQVPTSFWAILSVAVVLTETKRVNRAWQSPFDSERLFLQKDDHVPGDYGFDPLGFGKNKTPASLNQLKMKELNNGRLAMIAIAAFVGQELNTGLNVLPSDRALSAGQLGALKVKCAATPDEAACAKAFEAFVDSLHN
eukprot:CAMPEP_0181364046 /NCGR_PEP_ID=MMETSP1106-20121128/9137_1 /TAXON_ID=81844 /ORGANISM="Mantoniella antarctica, Strain SL-175" /LENGTH=255 /DNA_ID=CAMNT_0023478653 /DNA_START=32 /DNA_END=799 /DNA_ORIENTATION=+